MEIAPKPGTVFFFVLLFSIPLVVIYISTQRFQVVRPGIFVFGKIKQKKGAAVITSYDSYIYLVMIYFMHKNLNTATIGRNPDTHPSTCSSLSVLPSSSANIFA